MHKTFENNLVDLHKSKVAYTGMCILELSKILMCKFH